VLKITTEHIRFFLNGIDFPPSVQEMTLDIEDYEKLNDFSDIFEVQQYRDSDGMIEDEDVRNWASFEKHKVLSGFFDKCKRLTKLRVLNLAFDVRYQLDILRHFILPLLRAIPRLETVNFTSYSRFHNCSREHKLFDLGVFFSEIGLLHSLKHLRINSHPWDKWAFSGSKKLHSLSKLSSIEITGARIYSEFDPKKFFNAFLDSTKINLDKIMSRKTVKFHQLYISSSQDFVKILNLMGSVSHFRGLQVDLQILFTVENIDELYSNFPYPVYVASNVRLRVEIHLKHFEGLQLTSEQKQDLKMIFGQLQFHVYKAGRYFGDQKSLMRTNESFHDE